MIITTTACDKFGHPEFILEADTSQVPDTYLRDIAKSLEGMVAQGSVFRSGQTFQIGWVQTQVRDHEGGRLTLVEPDMRAVPVQWVPGITETLRQLMLQIFMLDSVSLRPKLNMPSMTQSLIACSRYTEPSFFMTRTKAIDKTDCGWFIGCLDQHHDHKESANLQRVSLYEAFVQQRGIQGLVSFPVGAMIVVERLSVFAIYLDGKKLAFKDGSFLDQAAKKRRQAESSE